MPYVRSRYYREEEKPAGYRRVEAGFGLLEKNTLFHQLDGYITAKPSHLNAKGSLACVTKDGDIYVNMRANLSPGQWCYVMAHNLLHLAFGHFDKASIPSDCEFVPALWNKACDIYITRFLYDIRLGEPICADPAEAYPIKLNSEQKIYEYLLKHQDNGAQICGTNSEKLKDMIGVERPIVYKKGERNAYAEKFSYAVTHSIKSALCDAGGYDLKTKKNTVISRAAEWFLSHYPLLGGLAATFKIVEDIEMCHRYEIHIAAVDAEQGIIYANPSCGFSEEEWIFVLAHEYLHAGLQHQKRCNGRDFFLWNIACDYVICGAYPNRVYTQMIEPLSEVPAGAIRFVNGNRLSVCPVSVMLILEGTPEENGITNYNTFSGDTMDTNAIWRNNCNLTEPYNFLTTVCLNYANPDCVPAGYTHLSITNLVPVDPFLGVKEEEYYDLKRRLANEMMEQYIKIGGVDFRGRIAEIEVSTPMTISHYVGAWKGSIYGYSHSMDNHVVAKKAMMAEDHFIDGLEFAGAHAVAGDGQGPQITNGRAAAKAVLDAMAANEAAK